MLLWYFDIWKVVACSDPAQSPWWLCRRPFLTHYYDWPGVCKLFTPEQFPLHGVNLPFSKRFQQYNIELALWISIFYIFRRCIGGARVSAMPRGPEFQVIVINVTQCHIRICRETGSGSSGFGTVSHHNHHVWSCINHFFQISMLRNAFLGPHFHKESLNTHSSGSSNFCKNKWTRSD
jgi:hypothetical protein